jgi:hypothetical protein
MTEPGTLPPSWNELERWLLDKQIETTDVRYQEAATRLYQARTGWGAPKWPVRVSTLAAKEEPGTLPEGIEQLIIGLWGNAQCYAAERGMVRRVAYAALAEGAAQERARTQRILESLPTIVPSEMTPEAAFNANGACVNLFDAQVALATTAGPEVNAVCRGGLP